MTEDEDRQLWLELRSSHRKVERILRAIEGDAEMHIPGLGQRLLELELQSQKLCRKVNVLAGAYVILTGIVLFALRVLFSY